MCKLQTLRQIYNSSTFLFCLNIFTAKAAGQSGSSVVRTHTAQIKIRQMSIPNKMRVFIFFLHKGIRKEKFNT